MNDEILSGLPHEPSVDMASVHVLSLAYMGDTIHDLFIREYLVRHHNASVHMLHTQAIRFVRCHEQSETVLAILDRLTEEEQAVFRRGRNAHNGTVPRNADVREYHNATGFEAVLGYLYLSGQGERLAQVLGYCMEYYRAKGEIL